MFSWYNQAFLGIHEFNPEGYGIIHHGHIGWCKCYWESKGITLDEARVGDFFETSEEEEVNILYARK